MNEFWLVFVPVFVAVDAVGTLPLFMGLTQGVPLRRVRTVIWQSMLTGTLVALLFLALGQFILNLLGITLADFMIAGGILLLIISMNDLLNVTKKQRQVDPEDLGAVPLGVPLVVGPGVLTTCLVLLNQHGIWLTGISVVINMTLAGLVFFLAPSINRVLGKVGEKIVSKLAGLLLTAIAVMMIRKGIFMLVQGAGS